MVIQRQDAIAARCSREAPSVMAASERARTPDAGCGRSCGNGTGWGVAGQPRLRPVARDDHQGRARVGRARLGRGPDAPWGWRYKGARAGGGDWAGGKPRASHEKVEQLLRELDYSLQGNRKTE